MGLMVLAMASNILAQTMNCVLQVPDNSSTAEGLATPYKMTGCNQTQFADEACFVEAAILDPATGDIQIYNPLVINQDQATEGVDFIAPVVLTLPANAIVGIFFGSNALTLTLLGIQLPASMEMGTRFLVNLRIATLQHSLRRPQRQCQKAC